MAEENSDKTLVGWAVQLQKLGFNQLATQLVTNVNDDFNLIYKLNLPTYNAYQLPVKEFLTNFKDYEKNFVYDKYYLLLIPKHEKLRKYSLLGFASLSEGQEFITNSIQDSLDEYILKISEFEENIFGCSIMSHANNLLAELTPGLQNAISYGTARVVSGLLTPFYPSVKYTTDNTTWRQLIWRAIKAIMYPPEREYQTHEIRGFNFLEGYFECAFTKSKKCSELRLVFFDVKLKEAYYNISSKMFDIP